MIRQPLRCRRVAVSPLGFGPYHEKSLPRVYVHMQHLFCILINHMRIYLKSEALGEHIAKGLSKLAKTQTMVAKELKVAQGQISRVISGDFKTKNELVVRVCRYVNIDPDTFR